MAENKYIKGLIIKAPKQGAPAFVKGSISIKREEMLEWLKTAQGEWINLDIKESKESKKWYAEINEWKPSKDPVAEEHKNQEALSEMGGTEEEINPEDIPF